LITGIVLFMTSFGWCAIGLRSATSATDLWLVTQAAWSGQGGSASQEMLQRHPDLQHVPVDQRGRVVYNLLMSEQLTAMPTGLWTGMFLSLFLGVVMGMSGTVVAGPLVRQNARRWILLLRYLEIVLPEAVVIGQLFLLAMLGLFSVARINLPLWHSPLLIGTAALAIAAALRRWPWPVRLVLFLFLTAMVLTTRYFEIRG
jgi:hypothetical protein